MERFVDSCIEQMSAQLSILADKAAIVNVSFWMQAYAFDVVGELAFGTAFGFLASGQDVGAQMANLRGWLRKRFAVGMVPWFFPIFMSPVFGIFSNSSREEQEDEKKRKAVLANLTVADFSLRGKQSRHE